MSDYEKLSIEATDNVYVKVRCERSVAMELHEHFTFTVPGAKHMPAFKNKIWDGKIRLFNLGSHKIYRGLLPHIHEFAKERDYVVEEISDFSSVNFSLNEAKEFISTLSLPFEPKYYQIDTFVHAIRNRRTLFVSPTASGKSLMIYLILRYLHGLKTVVIVPNVGLVHQMEDDFRVYGLPEGLVHKVFSGEDKNTDKPITITTWQSVYKLDETWFKQFDVVVGDEAHHFKATSLTTIMTKLVNAEYRFGFTGTLDGTETNQLVLEGLFGPKHDVTTTATLIEQNHLSQFRIKAIVLKYDEEHRLLAKSFDYKQEIDFIVQNEKRNKFIRNLALSLDGNTLILYQFVEKQGKVLYQLINNKAGDRKVFFVHGKVDSTDREDVRHIVNNENDSIIVASYGTFSTGINIPRIHNVIFASPFKSKIKVLQSIGRALRKAQNKDVATLFDIADNLSWLKKNNMTLKHFVERVSMYDEQKFDYKIYNVALNAK
jgi:superfamily II DNA or RNA helicase